MYLRGKPLNNPVKKYNDFQIFCQEKFLAKILSKKVLTDALVIVYNIANA